MRFPLTIPSGTAVESLEVEIVDLLRGLKEYDRWERSLLEALRSLMRRMRRR